MNEEMTCASEDQRPPLGALCEARSPVQRTARANARILVVDDDSDVLMVISKMLSWLGYEVIAGKNGIEGWTLYKETPCDIVLTDLDMPGMGGLTLARYIKSQRPRIPVVIMTGNQTVENSLSDQVQEGAIDNFLQKPFGLADLRGMLQRLSH